VSFPDGGTPKYVDFIVRIYEDSQRTKILAQFNKDQLGLKELSYGGQNIIILPYSDTEYEIIIDTSGGSLIHFKVDKNNKSVVMIPPNESKYNEQNKYYSRDPKEVHYDLLSEMFKQPQKVIDAKSGEILLENDQVIRVAKGEEKGWIGLRMNIILPSHDDFIAKYIPGQREPIFTADSEWPSDPETNTPYGEIPVLKLDIIN